MIPLIVGMAWLTLIRQRNAPRLYAALVYAAVNTFCEFFLADTGVYYYGIAAMADLLIMILTSQISPMPKMVVNLHRLCLISIIANGIGWLMWYFYLPPDFYNGIFIMLYAWAIIILCERDHAGVDEFRADSWINRILGRDSSSDCHAFKSETKI